MIDISVVIPTYCSEKVIESRVRGFEAILKKTNWDWEILICDDGSPDRSVEISNRLSKEIPRCRVLASPTNRGRGKNVSDGFAQCRGKIVGFVDADASTSAVYLIPAVLAIEAGFEVAEANRSYKIVLWELPFIVHRLMAHTIYAKLVTWGLGIKGHDTETGFKFFRRDALLQMLPHVQSNGWFWDTEIITVAHEKGFKVAEIASLFIRTKGMGSTVKYFRDSWSHFKNLMAYSWKKRALKLRQPCCGLPRF